MAIRWGLIIAAALLPGLAAAEYRAARLSWQPANNADVHQIRYRCNDDPWHTHSEWIHSQTGLILTFPDPLQIDDRFCFMVRGVAWIAGQEIAGPWSEMSCAGGNARSSKPDLIAITIN